MLASNDIWLTPTAGPRPDGSRVAARAGPAASRLAITSAIGMTSSTASSASGGTYTTGKRSAIWCHTKRPTTIPSGTPRTSPTIASSVACHMMARRESRRVRPIARRTARSCFRRRTVVTSAWATVATAISAKNTASTTGRARMLLRPSTAAGSSGGSTYSTPSAVSRSCCSAASMSSLQRMRTYPSPKSDPRSKPGGSARSNPADVIHALWSYSVCDVAGRSTRPTTVAGAVEPEPTSISSPTCRPSSSIVTGAIATSSAATGARPSSTTKSMAPSRRVVPNAGTERPSISTARAHTALTASVTSSSATMASTTSGGSGPPSAPAATSHVTPARAGSSTVERSPRPSVRQPTTPSTPATAPIECRSHRHRPLAAPGLDGQPGADDHGRRRRQRRRPLRQCRGTAGRTIAEADREPRSHQRRPDDRDQQQGNAGAEHHPVGVQAGVELEAAREGHGEAWRQGDREADHGQGANSRDDDRWRRDGGDRHPAVEPERSPGREVSGTRSHRPHESLSHEHPAADEHGDGEEHQRTLLDVGDLPHRSDAEEVLGVLDVHGMTDDRLDTFAERREVVRPAMQVRPSR